MRLLAFVCTYVLFSRCVARRGKNSSKLNLQSVSLLGDLQVTVNFEILATHRAGTSWAWSPWWPCTGWGLWRWRWTWWLSSCASRSSVWWALIALLKYWLPFGRISPPTHPPPTSYALWRPLFAMSSAGSFNLWLWTGYVCSAPWDQT